MATKERLLDTRVTELELDPMAALQAVQDDTTGAGVLFVGVVRDHDHGREVTALEYSAHPSASEALREITVALLADHPDVVAAVAWHRFGPLRIGDCALVVAVSSSHRSASFAACADLVERIKARIPVWKRQVFSDGTDEWVNSP